MKYKKSQSSQVEIELDKSVTYQSHCYFFLYVHTKNSSLHLFFLHTSLKKVSTIWTSFIYNSQKILRNLSIIMKDVCFVIAIFKGLFFQLWPLK